MPLAYGTGRKRADAILLGFRAGTELSERRIADKYRVKVAQAQPDQPGGSAARVKAIEGARDRLIAWVRAGSPPLTNDGDAQPEEPAAKIPEAPIPAPPRVQPVPVVPAAAIVVQPTAAEIRRPRYAAPETAPLVYKPYRPPRVFHRPLRFYLLGWWPWVRDKIGIGWLLVMAILLAGGAWAYQPAMEWAGRVRNSIWQRGTDGGYTEQEMIDRAPPHGHWNVWRRKYDYW